MSWVNGIQVTACEKCGAIVALTTRGGGGIDNEAGHAGWHETQEELLALLTRSAQAFANLTGGN